MQKIGKKKKESTLVPARGDQEDLYSAPLGWCVELRVCVDRDEGFPQMARMRVGLDIKAGASMGVVSTGGVGYSSIWAMMRYQ